MCFLKGSPQLIINFPFWCVGWAHDRKQVPYLSTPVPLEPEVGESGNNGYRVFFLIHIVKYCRSFLGHFFPELFTSMMKSGVMVDDM